MCGFQHACSWEVNAKLENLSTSISTLSSVCFKTLIFHIGFFFFLILEKREMLPREMVRKVEGNNSYESPCVSLGCRDSHVQQKCLWRNTRGGKKISAVFKNLTLAQKKVQILKSKTNVRVIRSARFLELWPCELDFCGDWIHGQFPFLPGPTVPFPFFKESESPLINYKS